MLKFATSFGLAAAAMAGSAAAQDMRSVSEPVIPASCATVEARLTSVSDGTTLAPADESKLDTQRIQNAIDACPKGKAVVLRAQGAANAFLSGPLELREGVTLLVDKGATLFASIDPKVFELASGSCGIVNNVKTSGCKPLIAVNNVSGAGIMGDGVIDGRGGIKQLGGEMSAWDIAEMSDRSRKALSRLVIANHADNFTLYRITLRNSPNFNVSYNAGDGFTVWGVKIDSPHRIPRAARPLARNTDGIDPGNGAKNITITHSFIRTGDDNVAIKGGKGGLTNMTVSHNHFYWGHGMSIGSETYGGVSKVRVLDLTLDGTDSGIRIKSSGDRGGLVQDVSYDDICIRNSAHPIELTAFYADGRGASSRLPIFRDITLRNVTISGGGRLVFDGFDKDHRVQPTLDGVFIADQEKYAYSFSHTDVTIAKGGSNLAFPVGIDATVIGTPTKGEGASCAGRFVPFPE
jgi:polygalacturonase